MISKILTQIKFLGESMPHSMDKNMLKIIYNNLLKLEGDEWIEYDWNKIESRPKESEKYFVHRKDGKVHWEKWNGSGWAYNEKVITHYRKILPPKIDK